MPRPTGLTGSQPSSLLPLPVAPRHLCRRGILLSRSKQNACLPLRWMWNDLVRPPQSGWHQWPLSLLWCMDHFTNSRVEKSSGLWLRNSATPIFSFHCPTPERQNPGRLVYRSHAPLSHRIREKPEGARTGYFGALRLSCGGLVSEGLGGEIAVLQTTENQ